MTSSVVIVGAGHNGLVASFYLARAGLDVRVIEALPTVGGACKTEELIPGFRFSTCANVTCWLRPEVVRDLRLIERGLEFSIPADPRVHCREVATQVLPDGSGFRWWADPDRLREEIARYSMRDAEAWPSWTEFWDDAARILGPYVMTPPPTLDQLRDRAQRIGRGEVLTTILTTSIAELADRFFESDVMRDHVQAPHDIGSVTDPGSSLALALEAAMHRYSAAGDIPPRGYVRGGMGRITQVMAEAARDEGVAIRAGVPVRRLLVEQGTAVGAELEDGTTIRADVVVSNADPKRTFLRLIAPEDLPAGLRARVVGLRTDIAPLKFHCALSELPQVDAFAGSDLSTRGSFFICPDRAYQERAWDDARTGRLPTAPIIHMMTPSAWDDSLAPAGQHTVSFWILFAPVHLREGSWPERREEMAQRLIELIDASVSNFRRALIDYVLLTPHDIEERVLLTDGNIHHVDIAPGQMLWDRPLPELAGYGTPIRNLYLCGAGMHPYGEVSGDPGHNAAHAILGDLGRVAAGNEPAA